MRAEDLLPPAERVLPLPGPGGPRVMLASHGPLQRWRHAGFYPAFKRRARLLRFALRLRAAAGLGAVARAGSGASAPAGGGRPEPGRDGWTLAPFLAGALPQADGAVVCLGTPGPAQKLTVQLWRGHREVVGYLKYGETAAARERLGHEHRVLSELPRGVAPAVLAFGPVGDGVALLTEAVPGRQLDPRPSSLDEADRLLARLAGGAARPLASHPGIAALARDHGSVVDPWLEPLADRAWPVVVQHGDLAPWNLIHGPGGVRAIDWEYGRLEGFPWLDHAYFLLRLAHAIQGASVGAAVGRATRYLQDRGLSGAASLSIVRLAAFDFHQKARCDGVPDGQASQEWRRAVFEWHGRT